jgi:hypothetical protein
MPQRRRVVGEQICDRIGRSSILESYSEHSITSLLSSGGINVRRPVARADQALLTGLIMLLPPIMLPPSSPTRALNGGRGGSAHDSCVEDLADQPYSEC